MSGQGPERLSRRARRGWPTAIGVALLCALAPAARAERRADPTPPRSEPARTEEPPPKPLSEEDAALVRELALLERVELLRNLELFEPSKEKREKKSRRP